MQKQEFEERIERTVTDEQYKVIEEVYMWHPSIRNTSGKDEVAELYKSYVGKAIYANNPARVIEKPHNDYLMQWVQNGFLALVAMIAFYVLLLKKCGTFYYKRELSDIKTRLGLGCYLGCICYMAGSLFNDSTLYTTPVFWIFAGIALGSAYEVEK